MARPRPLTVEADLSLTVEGETVRIDGYGDLVVVDAPSLRSLRSLRRGTVTLPGELPPGLPEVADVTVDVRVRGVSVGRVDPDRPPGPLATLLGTAPLRPSLGGLARALLSR